MDLQHTILYIFCALLNLTLGVLVLRHNSSATSHRFFFLFTFSQFLWISSLYLGYFFIYPYQPEKSVFFIRLAYAFPCFMYLFLPAFFYHFPRKTFSIPKWIINSLFFIAGAWFIAAAFTSFVHDSQILIDGNYVADNFGPLYGWYIYYFVASLILTLIVASKKVFDLTGIEQKKIILSSVGCWIFLSIILMTNVILPRFGIYLFLRESVAFSLFFLIPTFYAIQKYRFFDFSQLSLKFIRTVLLFITFIGTLYGSSVFLETYLSGNLSITGHILSALIALVVFLKVEKILPEFISSSFREFRYRLNSLNSSIYYCNNYSELIKKLESVFVLDLHFNSVQLYLIREKKNNIEIPVYFKDRYVEAIEKNHSKVLVAEETRLEKNALMTEFLIKMNASLCCPLYLEKKLIGFLVIGHKATKDYFTREEIEEIMRTKQYVELCFINILLQSDLKEENDYMKQLIQEKTKSLRHQNQKIKSLLQQQSDFIAVTAHEFRTPLNIALLQLEDTLESYEHSSHVLEDMKVLESSLDKLKSLTKNLFDVQQYDLKKVKVHFKEVDFVHFMTEIYHEFQDITGKEDIELIFENRIPRRLSIDIDELKMRQVFHNLMTNAQKFMQNRGRIIMRLEENPDYVLVRVIDNGPGIPENVKKKIFDKFQTAHPHMGMGLGLGLYLCKRIIDLHQGDIEVSDTPKGGATFTVALPKKSPVKVRVRAKKSASRRK